MKTFALFIIVFISTFPSAVRWKIIRIKIRSKQGLVMIILTLFFFISGKQKDFNSSVKLYWQCSFKVLKCLATYMKERILFPVASHHFLLGWILVTQRDSKNNTHKESYATFQHCKFGRFPFIQSLLISTTYAVP